MFCNDVLYLMQDFLVTRLTAAYPFERARTDKLALINSRLYVQVANGADHKQGELLHGCWVSWGHLANSLACSSYIRRITGPLWQTHDHRLCMNNHDGGYVDCIPRLCYHTAESSSSRAHSAQEDNNGVRWAESISTKPFRGPDPNAERLLGDRLVPHMVLSSTRWRTRSTYEVYMALIVNPKRAHVLDLACQGYEDACNHRHEFDAIEALVKRPVSLTSPLTQTWLASYAN